MAIDTYPVVIRQSPIETQQSLARHRPDEHWVVERNGAVEAAASIWWRATPPLPGHRVGVIGHFSATTDEAARRLLQKAEERLALHDCSMALGPMDGNTWRQYRFVTERGSLPPFFLEPQHPDWFPILWRAAGYQALAHYSSALATDLNVTDPYVERAKRALCDSGVRLRPLRLARFAKELELLHELSTRSFSSNFLYSPLSLEEFLHEGAALENRLRSELIFIGEQEGVAIGFVFALPDWLQSAAAPENQPGPTPGKGSVLAHPIDNAIIKTVAVVPEHRRTGLGSWLVSRVHSAAQELGFKRVIHALMHESNASMKVSARYATVFRKYELLGKRL